MEDAKPRRTGRVWSATCSAPAPLAPTRIHARAEQQAPGAAAHAAACKGATHTFLERALALARAVPRQAGLTHSPIRSSAALGRRGQPAWARLAAMRAPRAG
jgi:hypothetical protein